VTKIRPDPSPALATLVHEAGHALVARRFGVPTRELVAAPEGPAITIRRKQFVLRVGLGLGRDLRSKDPLGSFEIGPNPFAGGPYADRVRHVATLRRGQTLFVFFTGIGDAPERVLLSTIDLTGDWKTWKASAPVELLKPEAPYECADLPNVPSAAGEIDGPARQLRDPAIFEDKELNTTYLFYSICGEQGLAAARLAFR